MYSILYYITASSIDMLTSKRKCILRRIIFYCSVLNIEYITIDMAAVDREELELEANTSTADFWVSYISLVLLLYLYCNSIAFHLYLSLHPLHSASVAFNSFTTNCLLV